MPRAKALIRIWSEISVFCGAMTGLNLKIHAVDVQLGVVKPAVYLRAEQGWTVAHLKEAIAEV